MFAHVPQVDQIYDIAVAEAGVLPKLAIAFEMSVSASIGSCIGALRQCIIINIGSDSEATGDFHPALAAFTHFDNHDRFYTGVFGDEKNNRQFVFIMNTVTYENDLPGLDMVVISYG